MSKKRKRNSSRPTNHSKDGSLKNSKNMVVKKLRPIIVKDEMFFFMGDLIDIRDLASDRSISDERFFELLFTSVLGSVDAALLRDIGTEETLLFDILNKREQVLNVLSEATLEVKEIARTFISDGMDVHSAIEAAKKL
jgi:hypothetical protein